MQKITDIQSELNYELSRLTVVDDDPSAVFTSEVTTSSTEPESRQEATPKTVASRRRALNQFLDSCGETTYVPPHGQLLKPFHDLKPERKNTYVERASTAITAVLNVIVPEDGGNLWHAVQTSKRVEKALGVTDHTPAEKKYLEALAETYHNATTWNTRRQILAIMADLVSFRELQRYIPGLTEYRFKTARRHILQHGHGVALPVKKSPRMRVSEIQLDHFLTFITSSLIVQDLPFGQRKLKLSTGEIIEAPNVIRSMIPQRIIDQYTEYCKEEDVTPFSHSTMWRILTVCSATVRKSLQGLDYLAADGAKAFDDLGELVQKLESSNKDRGRDWSAFCQSELKKGKQYIKGDFKVKGC